MQPISFSAQIEQIKTMADGTLQLKVGLQEMSGDEAGKILNFLRKQVRITVTEEA